MTEPQPQPDGVSSGEEKERNNAVRRLMDEVQQIIQDIYGFEVPAAQSASSYLWDDSDAELRRLLRCASLHSRASVYNVSFSNNEHYSIVYFSAQIKAELQRSTVISRLTGDSRDAYLALIEEVSHFIFNQHHVQDFHQLPHSLVVELVGLIDRYAVMRKLATTNLRRNFNPDEQAGLLTELYRTETDSYAGRTPGNYAIGFRLGTAYLRYLINLDNTGGDVTLELRKMYNMKDTDLVKYLLYVLQLSFNTYGEQEKQEVAAIFQALGISALREDAQFGATVR